MLANALNTDALRSFSVSSVGIFILSLKNAPLPPAPNVNWTIHVYSFEDAPNIGLNAFSAGAFENSRLRAIHLLWF